ncbi:uncharacterized protein PAC_10089 [Phialocephala subalpina]|uniref:Uncharacterized protein n=1 Tax=Phialocephala subalpina TaxID=576137 RepID=A0A1L7X584_9HELO|nr:uncharacterized protein PAC_10089 [Phialocephala subalpina]
MIVDQSIFHFFAEVALFAHNSFDLFSEKLDQTAKAVEAQGVNPLEDGVLLYTSLAQTWSSTVAVSGKLRGRLIKFYLLEMKDMYWTVDTGFYLKRARLDTLDGKTHDRHFGLFFRYFPDLQELMLVTKTGRLGADALCNPIYQEECLVVLGGFFQRLVEKKSRFGVPNISLRVAKLSEPGCEDPDYEFLMDTDPLHRNSGSELIAGSHCPEIFRSVMDMAKRSTLK